LLERIRAEKERLIKEGKIKRSKKTATDKENMPFELPAGWCWCKLDDIVSFQGGFAYKSNTYVGNSDWQIIRIGNVKNDKLLLDNQPVFVSDKIGAETRKYLIKPNDILFSMTGTKGKRDYFFTTVVPNVNHNLLLNQRVGCLRRFSSDVDINYLCLTLKGEYVLNSIFATETGNVSQGNIGSENTLNLDIALPPLKEQKRIVKEINTWISYIDLLDNEKLELETRIQQAKSKILDLAIHGKLVPQDPNDEPAIELLKRINPKFEPCDMEECPFAIPHSWEWTNMGMCSKYESASIDPSKYKDQEFELYSVPSFETGMPDFVHGANISSSKKLVEEEDVLLCKINPHLNRTWIVEHHKKALQCIASSEWIIFRNKDINSQYLLRCFTSSYFLNLMLSNVSGVGGSLMRAQPSCVEKYLFPLPPYKEQLRIVAKIEELFAVLDGIKESLE
jgi:type I restriction enzyme S subunit